MKRVDTNKSEIAIIECHPGKWYGRRGPRSTWIYMLTRERHNDFIWVRMDNGATGGMSLPTDFDSALRAEGEIFQFDSLRDLCSWLDQVS